jgi:hypothetical protein
VLSRHVRPSSAILPGVCRAASVTPPRPSRHGELGETSGRLARWRATNPRILPRMGGELVIGVVGGLVATLLWVALVVPAYIWVRRRHIRKLEGHYRVTRKLGDVVICDDLEVLARGNVLTLSSRDYSGGVYSGKLVMSDEPQGYGRGHYTNVRNGQRLWGFLEIQVQQEDKEILAHEKFVTSGVEEGGTIKPGLEKAYGFVWRRA